MERAQGLGLGGGAGGNGIILLSLSFFLCFFLSCPFCLSLTFHLSAGTKGSGGGAPPSSRLTRRRRGYQGPVIL